MKVNQSIKKKKIVFLYTELAAYFLACAERLSQENNLEVHIVHWPVNNEAPFHFELPAVINIYNRNNYMEFKKLLDLIDLINPDVLYCSGWMDAGYLKISKKYKKKIPVIVGFDNQWKGSLKQWVAVCISPFKIRNHFSHCWVPGDLQYIYATRLGFSKEKILTGFYSCDFDYFNALYKEVKEEKEKNFPKRFIYVGRYIAQKGIHNLWQAFIELQKEQPNEWELWCLGTGNLAPVQHPKIKHFGFVQPADLSGFIKDTGVFILPSHFEPWGVVIHEFAAAGFPIICSDQVGSRITFVENNLNGYIYASGNVKALKSAMTAIMNSSTEKLNDMSKESTKKASLITPTSWAQQLKTLL